MLRIDTQQLGDGRARSPAATAEIIPHLFLVETVGLGEAHQCAAPHSNFRFHPFRVEGH